MQLSYTESTLTLQHKGHLVIDHSAQAPSFYLGSGQATYDMYRGNFDISDYLIEKLALKKFTVEQVEDGYVVYFSSINESDSRYY